MAASEIAGYYSSNAIVIKFLYKNVMIYCHNALNQKCQLPEGVLRCSIRKVFLKISKNSQENTCASVSFLIKLQASACNIIKKGILAQVYSVRFCEIFKNTFFYRTPLVAASQLWVYILTNEQNLFFYYYEVMGYFNFLRKFLQITLHCCLTFFGS